MALLKKAVGTKRAVIPSASTYNSMVESLNRGGIHPAKGFRNGNVLCVPVLNVGEHTIPLGGPVAFNNSNTEGAYSYSSGIFPGRWYGDLTQQLAASNPPWGIAQEVINPGCCGEVQIAGPAKISLSYSHGGDLKEYVVPTSAGGYAFSSSGSCRVLACNTYEVFCVLNSGGSSGGDIAYKGDFRLEAQSSSSNPLVMHGGTVHIGLDEMTVGGYHPAFVAGAHYCKLVVVWGGPSHPDSWTYRWEDSMFEKMSYLEWQKVLASYEVSNVTGVLYVTKVNQLWSNGSLVLSGRVV